MVDPLSRGISMRCLRDFAMAVAGLLLWAAPALAQEMVHYRADLGWASFDYPRGWTVTATDRSPGRFWDNYGLQPARQYFNGTAGQVAIRIFDPMYVIERSRLTGSYTNSTLFHRFLSALGASNASFGRETVGARNYFTASVDDGGFQTDYAAFETSNGYLDVLGMAGSPREADRNRPLLFAIAQSLYDPGPGDTLMPAEAAMRDWGTALRRGDVASLTRLSCAKARPMLAAMGLGALLFGGTNSLGAIAALYRNYDLTGLRYQTLKGGGDAVAVRTAGNMIVPGGVAPYTETRNFGDSNVVIVRRENGDWRICEPVRGGYR
jgi:hypothetical protein